MRRESRLSRALWIGLLAVLVGYVVADFVHVPFLAPTGSAAVRPAQVALWVSSGDSRGDAGVVVDQLAAGLDRRRHESVVMRRTGGSARAVIDFLSARHDEDALLAVTSTTVADLAHDRVERLVPGVSEEGLLAQTLLAGATPIGIVATEPFTLAVAAGSPLRSGGALRRALFAAPGRRVFGIADDTFSRDELAALVLGVGGDGRSHFRTFRSGGEAGGALNAGLVNTVLAPRGSLTRGFAHGRLRRLAWPLPGKAPRSWVALVARPGLPAAQVARLRRWIAGLCGDPAWLREQRAAGRTPAAGAPARLASLLRPAAADRLERIAARVQRR